MLLFRKFPGTILSFFKDQGYLAPNPYFLSMQWNTDFQTLESISNYKKVMFGHTLGRINSFDNEVRMS